MTVMFKQGGDGEGFNATFTIFSCPDQCPGNRTCINDQCVCDDGWTGPNCSLPLCPQNCSFHLKQGVCDRVAMKYSQNFHSNYYFFFRDTDDVYVRRVSVNPIVHKLFATINLFLQNCLIQPNCLIILIICGK